MIRAFLRACAAALGLRDAPTPEPTRGPDPAGDSVYSGPFWCPDCGESGTHSATCMVFPGEPVVAGNRRPPSAVPPAVLRSAEDAVNASFGLPPVWRCSCGGRPFEGAQSCPRCGGLRSEVEET